MNKKHIISITCVALIVVIVFGIRQSSGSATDVTGEQSVLAEQTLVIDEQKNSLKTTEELYEIQSGDTFNGIMQRVAGLPDERAYQVTEDVNAIFDVRKIRVGDVIKFVFTQEAFAQAEYDIDRDTTLRIEQGDNHIEISEDSIEYEERENQVTTTINSSLYMDGTEAGLSGKAVIELARIFSSDIDFATNIQPGDTFNVIYNNLYRDGEFVGVGDILAARFTNSGKDYYAFMVEDGEHKKYFNEDGESKELVLLKTPLNFSRISSQFTYRRKNPVSGRVGSHRAVDLVANSGTPIESVGNGTVVFAGTNGGYGKYIKVRHAGGYVTAYAHLSKIESGVKKGVSVERGQVIGRVGSTGNSTGPHLHYEVYKDGTPVNPFKLDLPPGEEIPDALRRTLQDVKDEYFERIK